MSFCEHLIPATECRVVGCHGAMCEDCDFPEDDHLSADACQEMGLDTRDGLGCILLVRSSRYDFAAREAELIAFLKAELPDMEPNDEITIESWLDDRGGYRISEISYFRPDPVRGKPFGAGGSWMQSETDAAGILFAAERFVVSRDDKIEEYGEDTYIDYRQEREAFLRYLITNPPTFGEWEDRR